MRAVDKRPLPKLDPTNTQLLAQKQKEKLLLGKSIDGTKKSLEAFKKCRKNKYSSRYKMGNASEEQYRALQREIVKTEQELKRLEDGASGAGKNVEELGDKAEKSGGKFSKLGGILKSAGIAMGTAAIAAGAAAIKLGKEVIQQFGELEQNLGGSEAVFGEYAGEQKIQKDRRRCI